MSTLRPFGPSSKFFFFFFPPPPPPPSTLRPAASLSAKRVPGRRREWQTRLPPSAVPRARTGRGHNGNFLTSLRKRSEAGVLERGPKGRSVLKAEAKPERADTPARRRAREALASRWRLSGLRRSLPSRGCAGRRGPCCSGGRGGRGSSAANSRVPDGRPHVRHVVFRADHGEHAGDADGAKVVEPDSIFEQDGLRGGAARNAGRVKFYRLYHRLAGLRRKVPVLEDAVGHQSRALCVVGRVRRAYAL